MRYDYVKTWERMKARMSAYPKSTLPKGSNGTLNGSSDQIIDLGNKTSGLSRPEPQKLRILSYNIQTGITSSKYHHYLTHSWKHVLPCAERMGNLDTFAGLLAEYDIVGLQEVDAGSLRSGFINQTKYLAERAHFPYWHDQTNRNLGKLAQHSTGVLSRYLPTAITEHKLPGVIPGRGALSMQLGDQDGLFLLILHLALGRRARLRQLGYVAELISDYTNVVILGDMNCRAESTEMGWLLRNSDLRAPMDGLHTFPSWRPLRNIDQILISSSLHVESVRVLDHALSDHLPIAMEITLPDDLILQKHIPRQARRARLHPPAIRV